MLYCLTWMLEITTLVHKVISKQDAYCSIKRYRGTGLITDSWLDLLIIERSVYKRQ